MYVKYELLTNNLQYVETLDLRCRGQDEDGRYMLSNKFYKMKRLKHLYLPRKYEVEGGEKLRFPSGGQMETIKNFDPSICEAEVLMQMTNLRVFSIRKGYICGKAEDLKCVLESPVIKKEGQLINRFPCVNGIKEDVLKENPLILSSFAHHSKICEGLIIWGTRGKHVKKMSNSIVFSNSVTWVVLKNCDTSDGGLLLGLGKLPLLKVLELEESTIGEATNKLSFSPHSFPHLVQLSLQWHPEWMEWEIGDGALPNLHMLMLEKCKTLNMLNNLPNSLTKVALFWCEIGEAAGGVLLLALENLPCLQQLNIFSPTISGNKLSFSAGSFPQLTKLMIQDAEELMQWEVGDGALPNLQRLKLERFNKLKKLPEGLPDSVNIECDPCIKGIEKYNTCPHFGNVGRETIPPALLKASITQIIASSKQLKLLIESRK